MRVEEKLTEERLRRFELMADGRSYVTGCPWCFVPGLHVAPTRKGGFHLQCLGCGGNGFAGRADLCWALVGCGEGLRQMPFAQLKRVRGEVHRQGRKLVAPQGWTSAQYGDKASDLREVLKWGVLCLGCGTLEASLRRDARGHAYVTCARACHSRVFFPKEASMRRHVGWSVLRADRGDKLWNDWYVEGRGVWRSWCSPGTTSEAVGEGVNDTIRREAEGG